MLGSDPWKEAAGLHRRIAYVPGDVSLWPNLTGGEVIDLLGSMRGGLDEKKRADLLERFELDPGKKARTYSKGNRQKVAVVAAFASNAELYLLDEPTSGLDPLMEAEFQRCVQAAKADGATVLLSSHILAEAEALSDRVSIIRNGTVVQSGTLAELRHLTRTTVIAETASPATRIGEVPGVHNPQLYDGRVAFDVDSDHLDAAVAAISALGIRALAAHPPTLEELFLRQYGEDVATVPTGDAT
jgi:ABC-2 type transport system ATP-binding protein